MCNGTYKSSPTIDNEYVVGCLTLVQWLLLTIYANFELKLCVFLMNISLHTRYVVLGFERQQDKHGNGKQYTIKSHDLDIMLFF